MNGSGKPRRLAWFWLAATVLMLGEFLFFVRMTAQHHAPFYPRWNDQIQYLMDAYHAHDVVQEQGLLSALKFTLGKNAVQGTLHDTAAAVVFWLTGSASRTAALSLNMLAFVAWQAVLLFTLLRTTGSRSLAWTGFGLLLCLAYPWSIEAGSAFDFRLDHAAMCLFGVTACTAVLTDGFRSRGWSLVFGLTVGVTILTRFLTAAYFAPLFAVTCLALCFSTDRKSRLRHLLFASLLAGVLVAPVFWLNRRGIYDYYWVGHVTGAESAARLRGIDRLHSIQFVFNALGKLHLGIFFGWVLAAIIGLLGLTRWLAPERQLIGLRTRQWFFWGAAFALIPAFILTLHRQKSEVVLGIITPGILLLIGACWQLLWPAADVPSSSPWRRAWRLLPAFVALGVGSFYFTSQLVRQPHSPEFLASAARLNQLADYIADTARARGLDQPNVGVDRIVDFLDGRILQVICYERHQRWIPFAVHLPDSILAGPDDVVFFKLRTCDFFLLTDEMNGHGYWPYEQQMERLYPQLKAWCDENLVLVDTLDLFGRKMSFYQRPATP